MLASVYQYPHKEPSQPKKKKNLIIESMEIRYSCLKIQKLLNHLVKVNRLMIKITKLLKYRCAIVNVDKIQVFLTRLASTRF